MKVGFLSTNELESYFSNVRKRYKEHEDLILGLTQICPYSLGIDFVLSPTEDQVWYVIRFLGIPMFPHYPIGKYFVDFADPKKKIAIEVDGREYHLDRIKDQKRESKIKKAGWSIIRFPGYFVFRSEDDFYDEYEDFNHKEYLTGCVEGILRKVYNR